MNIEDILKLRQRLKEKVHQRNALNDEIDELSDQGSEAIDGLCNQDREKLERAIDGKYFS
jgi:hypothetical protein